MTDQQVQAAYQQLLATPPDNLEEGAIFELAQAPPQAKAEALLAATFIGTAVDATTVMGDADSRGALVMNEIPDAQAQGPAGIKALLDEQLPTYYRFWSLINYLPTQVGYLERGGWPQVPSVKKLEPGQSNDVVAAIRAREAVVQTDLECG